MKSTSHIERLSRVFIYAAGDNHPEHPPKYLGNGFENIEILLGGEVLYPTPEGLKCFGRGTIFWHQEGEWDIWKNVSADHRYRCVCFTFQTSARARPVPEIGTWRDLSSLDAFVNEAMELFIHPETESDYLTGWVYGTLLRQFIKDVPLSGNQLPRSLYLALLHIDTALPRAISLTELTRIVLCSEMQINRLFMKYLHCTPGKYILRRRLLYGANLLSSALEIKNIAMECGFRTLPGFYNAFRKHFHCSPGEYRRRLAFCRNHQLSGKHQTR